MNSSLIMEIPVRIGSNRLTICINKFKKEVKVSKFISIALKKCKLTQPRGSYGLFETQNGIERLLNNNDDMLAYWNQVKKRKISIQLKIRKFYPLEKQILTNDCCNLNDKLVKSYYEKTRPIEKTQLEELKPNFEEIQQSKPADEPNFLQIIYQKVKEQSTKRRNYAKIKSNSCDESSLSSSTSSLTSLL